MSVQLRRNPQRDGSSIKITTDGEEDVRTLRFFLLIAAATVSLGAQTADQPLTNVEIESMLTAGFPESTILLRIQKAAHFGLLDLDASTSALTRLKNEGASEQILNAVVWAEPFGALWKEAQAAAQQIAQEKKVEDQAVPGLPDRAGVYFRGSSGWVGLSSFMFWAPFYSGWAWMHRRHEYSVPVGNAHSELQIAEGRPSFYVRMRNASEVWQIVRATLRNDQRELRLVSGPGFDQTENIPASQVLDVRMTHVAGSIFTLRPNAQLEPGEYALCTGVPGGPGLDLCYSFGIRP